MAAHQEVPTPLPTQREITWELELDLGSCRAQRITQNTSVAKECQRDVDVLVTMLDGGPRLLASPGLPRGEVLGLEVAVRDRWKMLRLVPETDRRGGRFQTSPDQTAVAGEPTSTGMISNRRGPGGADDTRR